MEEARENGDKEILRLHPPPLYHYLLVHLVDSGANKMPTGEASYQLSDLDVYDIDESDFTAIIMAELSSYDVNEDDMMKMTRTGDYLWRRKRRKTILARLCLRRRRFVYLKRTTKEYEKKMRQPRKCSQSSVTRTKP